jgi:hypothetical protein
MPQLILLTRKERALGAIRVARVGALSASHNGPLVIFALAEPSKEAHDSGVSVFQCRRTRRTRRGEPVSPPWPAGHQEAPAVTRRPSMTSLPELSRPRSFCRAHS